MSRQILFRGNKGTTSQRPNSVIKGILFLADRRGILEEKLAQEFGQVAYAMVGMPPQSPETSQGAWLAKR